MAQPWELKEICISMDRIRALLERGETLLYSEDVRRELLQSSSSTPAVSGEKARGKDPQHPRQSYASNTTRRGNYSFDYGMSGRGPHSQRLARQRRGGESFSLTPQQRSVTSRTTQPSHKSVGTTLSRGMTTSRKLGRLPKSMHECDDEHEKLPISELYLRIRRELEEYCENLNNRRVPHRASMVSRSSYASV